MAEGKIRVIMCPAERPPYVTNISNTLENMQRTVGGYIEAVTMSESSVLIVNEEGRLIGLPENPTLSPWFEGGIMGDAFICGRDGDEFADLPRWRVTQLLPLLKKSWDKSKKMYVGS